ncbi:tetratricopeptide repeat protein [Streptomyces scopuliridis]|uniref:tetratricopeptide repeat protein n=1 Tax=Streptomyces scopuliridis TaxID=452529 RepID=UPI0035DAF925
MTYQIPPPVPYFVGRQREQALAATAVAERDGERDSERNGEREGERDGERERAGESRPLLFALSALGGTGKTELAFQLARTLRSRHPDGVLYVDLDDFRRGGVVEVGDALGDLLGSLGVEPEWLKPSFKARCKQYWTKTDGTSLVIVVDNARYAAEVVPLLPASGDSVVIATSQGPLYDLEDAAAIDLALPPLDPPDAMALLRSIAGDARLAAEPEAARRLVGLCCGLPAALHVAGRWIRRHRRSPLPRLIDELTAELHGKGIPMVDVLWDAAYRGLGPEAALLYRMLPSIPGTSFTPEAATAILGRGRDTADRALEELESAGLLDTRDVSGTGDDRKRLPELLRAHAGRRAGDSTEEERAAWRLRIVRWFLRQAQRADRYAAGTRMTFADLVDPIPGAPDVPFGDGEDVAANAAARKEQAFRWLESERHALYASVDLSYARGCDTEAAAFGEPLWTHYLDHPHYADGIEAFRTALAAAQRAGHIPLIVRLRCQLARPLWKQGEFAEAEHELAQALSASGSLGESDRYRKLGASVVEFHGMLRSARGDWAAAAADFEASREVHRAIGNEYGAMLQTYRLGEAVAELGQLERAAGLLEEAHTEAGRLGRERLTARTGFALGGVLHRLGRGGAARELYIAALDSARERGADHDEARILDALAVLAEEEGRTAEARGHREEARVIRERNGLA